MQRENIPVWGPTRSSKLMRTTMSDGATTWANCGFISVPTRLKRTGVTLDHASEKARISVSTRLSMRASRTSNKANERTCIAIPHLINRLAM